MEADLGGTELPPGLAVRTRAATAAGAAAAGGDPDGRAGHEHRCSRSLWRGSMPPRRGFSRSASAPAPAIIWCAAWRGPAEALRSSSIPGERIEPKVLRQFARLLSPALTDVRVEWVGRGRDSGANQDSAGIRARTSAGLWIREGRSSVECSADGNESVGSACPSTCRFQTSIRVRCARSRRWPHARGSASWRRAVSGSPRADHSRRTERRAAQGARSSRSASATV